VYVSGRFVPLDILSCWMFGLLDVLSRWMFCPHRRFVPPDFLSHGCYVSGCYVFGCFVPLDVMSLDVLSGHVVTDNYKRQVYLG
jgi:hypothetical protein